MEKSSTLNRILADTDLKATVLQVRLRPETRALVEGVRDATGVPAVEVVARLLEWFTSQSKDVRRELMEKEGDAAGELVRERLGELAAVDGGQSVHGMSIEQCVAAIKVLSDRIAEIDAAHMRALGASKGKSK